MKLKDFIKAYSQTDASSDFNETYDLLNLEVPEEIIHFYTDPVNHSNFPEATTLQLSKTLNSIACDEFHDVLYFLIYRKLHKIFSCYEREISELATQIQTAVEVEKKLPQLKTKSFEHYETLLNIYLFTKENKQRKDYRDYPAISFEQSITFNYEVPLAINVLSLSGVFEKNQIYHDLVLGFPLYPLDLTKTKEELLPLRRGIKSSESYYPIKMVKKLVGVNLKNNFIATNGTKILYVRGTQYTAWAVLSSKIACFISAKHFSSERRLDNDLAATKKLPGYALCIADLTAKDKNGLLVKEQRKKFIKEDKKMIPGTGIIDEVLNFIRENDKNPENFGYSDSDIENCYLTKIDFDCCNLSSHLPIEQNLENWWQLYEQDTLTELLYREARWVMSSKEYLKEKLTTRLKLAMMPGILFDKLADKAYSDIETKNAVVAECQNRTEIALNLFYSHPYTKEFLSENPPILDNHLNESVAYIDRHFSAIEADEIKKALYERKKMISKKMNEIVSSHYELSLFSRNQTTKGAQPLSSSNSHVAKP